MIKSIEITNYRNEVLSIDIFNPKPSAINIREINGLGPVKADITTTKMVVSDGDIYNSARANGRNIVLTLGMEIVPEIGINSIEDCRQKIYKYFPLKRKLKFKIITDNRELYTYGYVESDEPDIFSDDETAQISIVCPNSWMISDINEETSMSNVKEEFRFPLEVLEKELEPYDLADTGDPRHLNIVRESGDAQNFYGNYVFNFFDDVNFYADLEKFTYEELQQTSYKGLMTISKGGE